jgi:hypothetical protein
VTTRLRLVSFASALALPAFACPAQALVGRAWVSGHGADTASCGAVASPCRTLQYVHDNIIAAGGEIDILDPAGYGPLTIRKSLTVANDGVGVSDLQQAAAGANGITVDAGASDEVNLRGLSLDGDGMAAYGVRFNSGALLTIRDSIIRGFAGAGVRFTPAAAASFTFSNVTLSKNDKGVFVQPQGAGAARGVIDHSSLDNNTNWGVLVQGGSAAAATASVTLCDSSASQNKNGVGVGTAGARASLLARDVTASNNQSAGFLVSAGGAVLRLAHSAATGNRFGVAIGPGGAVESFGDNNLRGNGASVSGGGLTLVSSQ